jgi:hypothetical protein
MERLDVAVFSSAEFLDDDLGLVVGRGVGLVGTDRMRGETAYISFCGVLAPTFRQTTSSDRRCLGAECDRDNAHQLLSEHKTICADGA